MTTDPKPLNNQQLQLIRAINAGKGRLRDLQAAANYSSISVVRYNLQLLAARGDIILLKSGQQQVVYTGRDYARAWDAAARLAGNPDA